MCQVILAACVCNPFAAKDAPVASGATASSKKRARPAAVAGAVAAASVPRSPVSIDAVHCSLRTKRARPAATWPTAAAVERHASPRPTASRAKSRSSAPPAASPSVASHSVASHSVTSEVKTLQSKVETMQTQVQGAAAGVRELRHMVAMLALRRRRAEMLALYRRAQQQQAVECCEHSGRVAPLLPRKPLVS